MNLERTKPETLAAGVMDLTPSQSLAAHDYAERLNAALARLGLTERLTLPPAPNTAIDELPAVVDVPLRKTLSVLMGKAQQGDASALATLEWTAQVAESIFAGLHARDFAGDRPLALPSHESLATLSQGVDALLPRKISNGAWSLLADGTPSDGIQDGTSLVRLLCDSTIQPTELIDDNEGWIAKDIIPATIPSAKKMVLNCVEIQFNPANYAKFMASRADLEQLEFPKLVSCEMGGLGSLYNNMPKVTRLEFPELQYLTTCNEDFLTSSTLEEFIAPNLQTIKHYNIGCFMTNKAALRKVVIGNGNLDSKYPGQGDLNNCPNLIHLELAEGYSKTIYLPYYNPTSVLSDSERLPEFLSNFKTYIAERLSEQGSGLTLTLSQAVRDAIEGDPTIAQIITSKGWTISPAPTA